jgi:hypothetical protein
MTHHAKTGGILTIISGVFCVFYIMMGIFYALIPRFLFNSIADSNPSELPAEFFLIFTGIGVGISIFFTLMGALAITGGIFAVKRKNWALAIAGAIAGTILFFPLGIVATILVSLGKSEFSAVEDTSSPGELQLQESGSRIKPGKATTTGILTIISGAFGIFWLGYALFLNGFLKLSSDMIGMNDPAFFIGQMYHWMGIMYIVWGAAFAALGIFTIIAGVKTLKRANWKLGLAGAIASTILFFPCGIPAIMLMYNAYDEFSANSTSSKSMSI